MFLTTMLSGLSQDSPFITSSSKQAWKIDITSIFADENIKDQGDYNSPK